MIPEIIFAQSSSDFLARYKTIRVNGINVRSRYRLVAPFEIRAKTNGIEARQGITRFVKIKQIFGIVDLYHCQERVERYDVINSEVFSFV